MADQKKHCSDWNDVTQQTRNGRLEHWAKEIKGWEEQIEWLEAVLEERLNYEG